MLARQRRHNMTSQEPPPYILTPHSSHYCDNIRQHLELPVLWVKTTRGTKAVSYLYGTCAHRVHGAVGSTAPQLYCSRQFLTAHTTSQHMAQHLFQ